MLYVSVCSISKFRFAITRFFFLCHISTKHGPRLDELALQANASVPSLGQVPDGRTEALTGGLFAILVNGRLECRPRVEPPAPEIFILVCEQSIVALGARSVH